MSAPLRLGVVGVGAVAQTVYLPLIARHPARFRLSALCDVSPSTLAAVGEQHAILPERRFPSVGALLEAGGLDAVIILTSGSHALTTELALRAGLAVLCEKPLAYTLDEIDRLAATANAERLQLGYMKLYDPAFVSAARLAAARPPPRSVEVTVLHPSSASQLAHAGLLPPAADIPPEVAKRGTADLGALQEVALGAAAPALGPLYTGVLLGSIVHDLAMIRVLVGDPTVIDFARTWPDGTWPPSVEIAGALPNGARLSIRWHYLDRYPAYRETLAMHDEEGSISLTFPSPYLLHAPTELTVVTTDGGSERVAVHRSTVEAFEEQLLAFERLARDGTRPAAGIADGRADIVTCQRIAARLAAGQSIAIGGEAAEA